MPDNRGNLQSADKGQLPAYEGSLQSGQVFKLHAPYSPTGDQPQAIEQLVEGFRAGNQFQTLLGVTGSGKTFTMANISRKHMFLLPILISPKTLPLMMKLRNCGFRQLRL